jgi:hypothetical protein
LEAVLQLIDSGAVEWAERIFSQFRPGQLESDDLRLLVEIARYRLSSRTGDPAEAAAMAADLVSRRDQVRDPWIQLQLQSIRICMAASSAEVADIAGEIRAMSTVGEVPDGPETTEVLDAAARLAAELDEKQAPPMDDGTGLRELLRWWSNPGALPPHFVVGDEHSLAATLHAQGAAKSGRLPRRTKKRAPIQDPSPEAARALAESWDGATEAILTASRLAAQMRLGDALVYLEEVHGRAKADGHTRAAAISAILRGHVLGALGDRAGAIDGFRDGAADFRRIGEPQLLGHACVHIGRFAALDSDGDDLIGDWVTFADPRRATPGQRTLTVLRSAQVAFEVLGDKIGLAEVRLGEIIARWTAGDGWLVKHQLGELADACWRLGPDAAVLAMEASVLRAQLMASARERKELRRLLRRLRRRSEAQQPFWSWQLDVVEGRSLLSDGDSSRAGTLAARALDAIDQLRWRVGDELQRSMWIVPRRRAWELAIDIADAQRDATAGLLVVERGKSMSFTRLLLARAASADAPVTAAVNQALLARTPLVGSGLTADRQTAARTARAAAIESVRRGNARLAATIDPPTFEPSMLATIAARIGPFGFLDYLELGPRRWWLVWGTQHGPAGQHRIELSPQQLNTLDRLLSIGTGSAEATEWMVDAGERDIRALGQVLLPPSLDRLPGPPLLISASGALTAVPYGALDLALGVPVLDRFAVIHVPSLTTAATLPPVAARDGAPVIFACDPEDRLSGLRRQVEGLSGVWPAVVAFEAGQATLESLRQLSASGRLSTARSLVFAAHGAPHPDDPVASGVLLGDGEVLNAGMLLALRLPSLVEFWTCGSGAERPLAGEEQLGLVASALMAGAHQVLASTWSLLDRYAPFLSTTFHSALLRGLPGPEALRETQKAAASAGKPFVAWAPLAIHGTP